MSAYLEYSESGSEVRRFRLPPITSIGRDSRCEIPLNDPLASRQHAMVRRVAEGSWYAMDLGSRNGTYLNGLRLTLPTVLNRDDILTVGQTSMRFICEQRSGLRPDAVASTMPLADTMTQGNMVTQVTVLVADLRGYTSLSEGLEMRTLSRLMSRWFDAVAAAVREHGGIVDKYIGDAVMARWEDPERLGGEVLGALRGALAIVAVAAALNDEFDPLPVPLRVGVGINTGLALTGVRGDASPLGDDVNVAFRLEEATRTFDCDLVLSEASFGQLGETVLEVRRECVQLRGKAAPVETRLFSFDDVQRLVDCVSGPA